MKFHFIAKLLYFAACCRDVVVVVTRPLPRDGGMAKNHKTPEAGQLPRVWIIGRKETESGQRVSDAESP